MEFVAVAVSHFDYLDLVLCMWEIDFYPVFCFFFLFLKIEIYRNLFIYFTIFYKISYLQNKVKSTEYK